jgi:hypothetical protein
LNSVRCLFSSPLVFTIFFSPAKMSEENDNTDGSQHPLYSLDEFLAEG